MTGGTERADPKRRFVPFGRYLLLERIAVGGMAEVYLAKRFDDGEVSDLLAIKRIRPALARNDEFIRMFLDEAKIAARLDHPSIVRTLELGRIGRSHYLALDFVWGKDLLQIMRRVKLLGAQLSSSFVAWVGIGMCEALHHAHEMTDRHGSSMGLIHRDVSPQNVLISFDGVVKLIDFGIAKANVRSTETQAGVLKGKVGYMSPEQVAGAPVDRRSDLFAVGTCLYELLTLRTLFARENAFEAMENVRFVRAKPLQELRAELPDALVEILRRAHAADPDERWQTGREMSNALRGFLSDADPSYDRVSAVGWIRDAFRKEFHGERGRLDAFDQLGRAQVVSAEGGRRNSVTDLQIEQAQAPAQPEWDTTGDAIISDAPVPAIDDEATPEDGPTEIFFRQGEVSQPGAAEPSSGGRTSDPFRAEGGLDDDVDVSLDPSQIDSAIIERLLPPRSVKAEVAREDTQRVRAADRDIEPPRRGPRSGRVWLTRIGIGLALLLVGAAGTYAYSTLIVEASIEVRTEPDVGATVLLDGVQRGTAPLRIDNVSQGSHQLTIVAAGYRDAHREIDVSSNTERMVEVLLVPAAPP